MPRGLVSRNMGRRDPTLGENGANPLANDAAYATASEFAQNGPGIARYLDREAPNRQSVNG